MRIEDQRMRAKGGGGREGKRQGEHGGRLDEVGHVQRLEEGGRLSNEDAERRWKEEEDG